MQVGQRTELVYSYGITTAPKATDDAWSDVFIRHDISDSGHHYNSNYSGELNLTTSHGVLFLDAIFGSATQDDEIGWIDILDNAFDFRDSDLGINMYLMTYSMYSLLGKDAEALLKYTALTTNAHRTFQPFFFSILSTINCR